MAGFQPVDFNYYLGRKYALLQQQADATTSGATTAAKNAATNAIAANAAAGLDNTRAKLLPAESAASIAKSGAETALLGEQAEYFGPTAEANIANTNASTYLTGIQGDVAKREGLMERTILPSSLQSVLGARGYTGYKLPSDLAPTKPLRRGSFQPRFPGDVSADELDRLNGF